MNVVKLLQSINLGSIASMSLYIPHEKIALSNPLAAVLFYMGSKKYLHRKIMTRGAKYLLGQAYSEDAWLSALNEIENHDMVPMNTDERTALPVGNQPETTFGKWIYCAVRALRPAVVLETGVSHGMSSWLILNALHKNAHGQLYSIDLPNRDTNVNYNFDKQANTGWVVPESLRNRWELHLGSSRELLPGLLQKLGHVDIFFHDSEHSYDNMFFEFNETWPFLNPSGIVISDDVHKNAAFNDFVAQKNIKAIAFRKGGSMAKDQNE